MHITDKKNIKEIKCDLRLHFREIRTSMASSRKKFLDRSIRNKVFLLREYAKNDIIFTYVSKEIEVDTFAIMSKAISEGKTVAVPRCITDTREMKFYKINSFDDLEPGAFGVLEPIVSKCDEIVDFSHGLCIVPGFAFDIKGYRLGYGKGYYDRFLSGFKGSTVGLCYSNCIAKKLLPHGYYDKPVDVIVTDKYIRSI